MEPIDLADLLASWETHLRAQRKSPETVRLYLTGVRAYLGWCDAHGQPTALDRATVSAFIADLLASGREAATARARHLALRRFAAWLVEEGELEVDPLLGLKPPKLDEKVVEILSEEQLRALLAACQGPTLRDRRDEAIVRVLLETGLRAGELLALEVDDVDLRGGLLVVRRGKGGKGRVVPFSAVAARSMDRYLRLRRRHPLAETTSVVWLGDRGRRFGYDALHKTLADRAQTAGIAGFRPHRLRHTAASRWLAAGGSEGGALTVFGWKQRDLLDRYVKSTAAVRAAAEARNLHLGDL